MTSRAKQPKTAKMTFCPPWRTTMVNARTGGMTMAARAARRSAAKPGSAGAVTENRGRRGGAGVSVLAISVPLLANLYSYTRWMTPRLHSTVGVGLTLNRDDQKKRRPRG